jgi:CHAD domain-containing protein
VTVDPADLLARPAAEATRLIALGYLEDATRAATRLEDPDDEDALHDFRVALRRLRSTLRAYRLELRERARRSSRDRLGKIADTTNRSRDADVALAWLRPLASDLTSRERVGLRELIERIERRREDAVGKTVARVQRSFAKAAKRLRKRLGEYRQTVQTAADDGAPALFPVVAAAAITEHAADLGRRLEEVRSPDQFDEVHAARIAAKRLRYLLEPLGERIPGGAALVRQLRELQDLLGDLCDTRVLATEVETAVTAVGATRARRLFDLALADVDAAERRKAARANNERPGLLAVARRLRARRDALFTRLQAPWLRTAGAAFLRDVESAARVLAQPPPAATPGGLAPAPSAHPRRGPGSRWRRAAGEPR